MPLSGVREVTVRARREVAPFRQVQPSCAGSIALSDSATWLNTGSPLTVSLTSNGVGVFTGWSGTLSGTQTSASISVPSNVPEFVARFNSTAEPLTIESVFPSVIGEEASPLSIRVRGTGFTPLSQVVIGGSPFPVTYVNSTTLDANVERSRLAQGRLPVFVRNALSVSCFANSASVALDALASGTSANVNMVEYYVPDFDYYFYTGRASDKQLLDGRTDFRRTGSEFQLFSDPQGELEPLERFFFAKAARSGTRGTHFYTSIALEQRLLAELNVTNAAEDRKPLLEGIEGYTIPRRADGSCPDKTVPVYRAFKGEPRYVDEANHRFSTSIAQHRDMVDRLGWTDEGVRFCALP
jgi:hypothetical protein